MDENIINDNDILLIAILIKITNIVLVCSIYTSYLPTTYEIYTRLSNIISSSADILRQIFIISLIIPIVIDNISKNWNF